MLVEPQLAVAPTPNYRAVHLLLLVSPRVEPARLLLCALGPQEQPVMRHDPRVCAAHTDELLSGQDGQAAAAIAQQTPAASSSAWSTAVTHRRSHCEEPMPLRQINRSYYLHAQFADG